VDALRASENHQEEADDDHGEDDQQVGDRPRPAGAGRARHGGRGHASAPFLFLVPSCSSEPVGPRHDYQNSAAS
jgi:hypothetical protein